MGFSKHKVVCPFTEQNEMSRSIMHISILVLSHMVDISCPSIAHGDGTPARTFIACFYVVLDYDLDGLLAVS